MYISYSGYKTHESCPRQYWYTYPSETQPPEPDNSVNSFYGSVVGNLMEDFYKKSLWKEKDVQGVMEKLIEPTYNRIVEDTVRRGRVIRWKSASDQKPNYESKDELLADVRDTIARAIRIVRFYRLVGPRMEAETKLDSDVNGHRIGGRSDFIIKRTKPHNDLVILDGKGSKHRGKYIDPTQLRWYAMLYSLRNKGEIPDKLGFVYWRFDPPESMDWVDFSQSDLDDLMEKVLGTISKIEKGLLRPAGASIQQTMKAFPTRASKEACRFCAYVGICKDGQAALEKKSTTGV